MLEEVFVVAPGSSEAVLEIFSFSRRVPVFKKVEDRSPLNRKVSVRRVPVFKIVEDRSSVISEGKFVAYTGLQYS